jgi:hypothetical protein
MSLTDYEIEVNSDTTNDTSFDFDGSRMTPVMPSYKLAKHSHPCENFQIIKSHKDLSIISIMENVEKILK